ncbi:hypothetical protein DA792_06305 [Celeribacter baekdonensis]|uniref:Uncharacterized protein n=1 Tax=Celeribacter baekdonensis TaxID=875171 RepID=A0A2R4M0U7_9RHOB|nr:hypothetical protein DA792_06305 [Celeribacter baekdonensis]
MAVTTARLSETRRSGKTSGRLGSGIVRHDTAWGYCLLNDYGGPTQILCRFEQVARAVSILAFAMMAGLWLLPNANFTAAVIGIKAALSLSLGLIALAFGSLAKRGLHREVQIDTQRGQVRVVWRNRKSAVRLHTVIGFDEIGSVFLRRSLAPFNGVHLDVRYGRKGEVITLLKGEEARLREIWRDLNVDLRQVSSPAVPPERGVQSVTRPSRRGTPPPRRAHMSSSAVGSVSQVPQTLR